MLKPSAVARALGAAALILVVLSVAAELFKFLTGHDEVMGLLSLVDLDQERNIPTLFSVLLLAFASLCAAVIAALAKAAKARDVSRWAVLAVGFLYLAFDEGLSLHERLSVPVKRLLGSRSFGFSHSFWAIPGLIVVCLLGLFFLKFLLRLPAKSRLRFVIAGVLFLGGAVGFELISGDYWEARGKEDLGYGLIATVEESLEMAGVIVFIYGLLTYMAETYGEIRFQFGKPGEKAGSKAVGS